MPVILEDIEQSIQSAATTATAKHYDPKFFDSKLTGKGNASSRGVLSLVNSPISLAQRTPPSYGMKSVRKRSFKNGQTTINMIPLNIIDADTQDFLSYMVFDDKFGMAEIGNDPQKGKVYLHMEANSICIEETILPGDQYTKSVSTKLFNSCYRIFLLYERNKDDNKYIVYNARNNNRKTNCYEIMYSTNPMAEWDSVENRLKNSGYTADPKAFIDYMAKYDLYDAVAKQSELWQEKTDEVFAFILDKNNTRVDKRVTVHYVRYLMTYNVPLEKYKAIYNTICQRFSKDDAIDICKENLNLLLSDHIHNLQQKKSSLQTLTVPSNVVEPASVKKLSTEQIKAVKSTEPLVMVQAGAGSGKSTMLLARMDYLIACGVQPKDITVLSFTNAAADHISEHNNSVHSMTIARMIHEIYSLNYPNHELSTIDTIINAIDIYYPNKMNSRNKVISEFAKHLYSLMKNDPDSYTSMNIFVEKNFDAVIDILNTIGQTSLELEIILCYQKIDTFKEPVNVQSRYLILDEVQDNSIFEFIYTLKYVEKHQESLFIVGDCSQTLYEFRASNPKALNILESSGVFTTYQLRTNYRSNQEILDFANIALQNIEANQYANIQLHANSMATVTEDSFMEKVNFHYHRLNKIGDFKNALPSMFAVDVKPYIDACIKRGEQVAFLAFTRREIQQIREILTSIYKLPDNKIVSLVPDKMYNFTVFSAFIKKYWNEITFVPPGSATSIIANEIMQRLPYLVYSPDKARQSTINMLHKWSAKDGPVIASWAAQFNAGRLTQDEFLKNLKESMLHFEINENAIKQSLLSETNRKQKESDLVKQATFILSTIHSAKGLEFDNVVTLYRNETGLDEEKKRMYYVAFTRAMKSEFILAYDVSANPQIEADYFTVLERLHEKYPSANSLITKRNANRVKIKA